MLSPSKFCREKGLRLVMSAPMWIIECLGKSWWGEQGAWGGRGEGGGPQTHTGDLGLGGCWLLVFWGGNLLLGSCPHREADREWRGFALKVFFGGVCVVAPAMACLWGQRL